MPDVAESREISWIRDDRCKLMETNMRLQVMECRCKSYLEWFPMKATAPAPYPAQFTCGGLSMQVERTGWPEVLASSEGADCQGNLIEQKTKP